MTEHHSIVRTAETALRQGLPLPRTPLDRSGVEVASVCRAAQTCRLVTITGQGGIGKTRIAIEVAVRQSRRVVFVPLADLDRSGVAGAIFRACTAGNPSRLSGPIASGVNIVAGVWAGLAQEIAFDPLLLILDTFEHVSGAAALVSQIQSAIPDLVVLVTSRCRLGLRDERVVPLTGLSVDREVPLSNFSRTVPRRCRRSSSPNGTCGHVGRGDLPAAGRRAAGHRTRCRPDSSDVPRRVARAIPSARRRPGPRVCSPTAR